MFRNSVLFLFSMIGSTVALASNWSPLLVCDNGAAVLDVNTDERRNLQLVIRDPGIVGYLNRAGAVHSSYGATEVVLSGGAGWLEFRQDGPIVIGGAYSGHGVFSQGDFRGLLAEFNYYYDRGAPFAYVHREGSGLKVQFGRIEGRGCAVPTHRECQYIGDGFGTRCDDICDRPVSAFVEQANWYFQTCR